MMIGAPKNLRDETLLRRAGHYDDNMIRRNYICRRCGVIRRAFAHLLPGAPTPPQHCGEEMPVMSYEQTVAANRLEASKRVDWLNRGAGVIKTTGRRRWKPA
jgi:hypothetical protein